ncbi:MAG: bacillithiol biosynthesis deacetylase BshB1 [Ignavibacteriales bacterium]|nr:bacillithiol biosynthesis deacetylase BshB1 [Ignavibacteriales bacterium]
MNLDILAFGAHPDDVELSIGGTIAKLTRQKLKVGIVDFSQGEMGTRGNAKIRLVESKKAAEILKVKIRENLSLLDGGIRVNPEFVNVVVKVLRKHRPKIVLAPFYKDRHPDHIGAGLIIKEASYLSGLDKYKTIYGGKEQNRHRPFRVFYFFQTFEVEPTFIVDISETFDLKMKSIKAYKTQFHNPKSKELETTLSNPNFLKYIEARCRLNGFKIGKEFGEPFYCEQEVEMDLANFINKINSRLK